MIRFAELFVAAFGPKLIYLVVVISLDPRFPFSMKV